MPQQSRDSFPSRFPARRFRYAVVVLLAAAALCWSARDGRTQTTPVPTGKRAPLLMEGKTTLYQRVLTRPGAKLASQPSGQEARTLPAMSVMFVYGRQDIGERIFLEVGPDSEGRTSGWIDAAKAIPWRHSLVLAFTNPANRERVLFFRDRDSLRAALGSPDLLTKAGEWRRQIDASTLPPDGPVVSIEPETFIDLQKQFYLLPILEAERTSLPSGFRVRSVKIASVTKEADTAGAVLTQRSNAQSALANFRSSIVFVIDATSSMQPYINRTRQAVETVYREIETANIADRVRFGVVGFRDNPEKVRGIEYLAKVFADPNTTDSRAVFMKQISSLNASVVSTRAFAEDGYAGLEQALMAINWKDFGGRYVIMVTDASSREGNSPLSATKMSTDQIRQLAERNQVALYVMHLKTDEGRHDHPVARAQYERLSQFSGVGSLYFPVDTGDAELFQTQVQKLAQQLVNQVREAEKTDDAVRSAKSAQGAGDRLAEMTEAVGQAMRLAYLGTVQGTRAPPMFEAWASDRDFTSPDTATFSVRLLLTKNQLSDLQATLRRVVDAGEKGQIEPDDFFNQLRSAAVAMGRDPSRVAQGKARNLEDVGLMGEYLEGLPYQSKLMSIDTDSWTRMGVGDQQTVIDDIKSKIALYERFHDNVDQWVKLHDEASAGDAVYPIPIDSLP